MDRIVWTSWRRLHLAAATCRVIKTVLRAKSGRNGRLTANLPQASIPTRSFENYAATKEDYILLQTINNYLSRGAH